MRTSRILIPCLTVGALLALAGCAAEPDPAVSVSSSPSAEASATPSPSAVYEVPSEPVPGEVASAVAERRATPPSSSSVAGPGALAAGLPFSVEGECIGTSADFTVTTADPADAGRVLVEGTLDCAEPRSDGFTYTFDYAGPVQLAFTDTDRIDRGWLRVVQP